MKREKEEKLKVLLNEKLIVEREKKRKWRWFTKRKLISDIPSEKIKREKAKKLSI